MSGYFDERKDVTDELFNVPHSRSFGAAPGETISVTFSTFSSHSNNAIAMHPFVLWYLQDGPKNEYRFDQLNFDKI